MATTELNASARHRGPGHHEHAYCRDSGLPSRRRPLTASPVKPIASRMDVPGSGTDAGLDRTRTAPGIESTAESRVPELSPRSTDENRNPDNPDPTPMNLNENKRIKPSSSTPAHGPSETSKTLAEEESNRLPEIESPVRPGTCRRQCPSARAPSHPSPQ